MCVFHRDDWDGEEKAVSIFVASAERHGTPAVHWLTDCEGSVVAVYATMGTVHPYSSRLSLMEFYMKHLIPQGGGAFYVVRFVKNTEEGGAALRDALLAAGDWSDATAAEYDNFLSGAEAVGGVLTEGKEYLDISGLSDEERRDIRAKVFGA